MKRLLTALFLLISAAIYAQNATQITEDCIIRGPLTGVAGKYKYSYVVSDEGERIKNGPISITGKENYKYGNVTVTGNYTLTASAKMGLMNGPISVKANYHGVQQRYKTQVVEDYAYSFTGNFLNGIPNGTFTVKATDYGSSTATYKNGVLVGAYSVDESIDKRFIKIKGAFNDKGKMIGVWHFNNLGDESDWEFINGIRIRVSSKKEESTPKQIEMARKYATGAIGLDELKKEGYAPVVDSLRLGDYASDLYFIEVIADWDRLAKCNFGTSYWVKYTYLYNILPLPDKEFQNILSNIESEGKTPHRVEYDEKGMCYITYYYVNYGTPAVDLLTRRFSAEQWEKAMAAKESFCRENPLSISDMYYKLTSDYRERNYIQQIGQGFKRLEEEKNYNILKSTYESLVKDIEGLSETLEKGLEGKEKTSDGLYYIILKDGYDTYPFAYDYFPTAYKDVINSLNEKVREYEVVIEQKREEAKQAAEKAFLNNISGIELKSKEKAEEQLLSITTRKAEVEYKNTFGNGLNISAKELAEAIAPVVEYRLLDIQEESAKFDTYKVSVEFKKKKEAIIVTMSITNEGKIVSGTITLPQDVLDKVRKNSKIKGTITKYLRF